MQSKRRVWDSSKIVVERKCPKVHCDCSIWWVLIGCVLQEAALRTYHISDDPANYYLAEVTDKGPYVNP